MCIVIPQSITYWGTGRNRFQLEVPLSAVSNSEIEDYELTSQKKGVRRYRTPELNAMLQRLVSAEETRDKCLQETMENLFNSFAQQ